MRSWKPWAAGAAVLLLAGGGAAWWWSTRAPDVTYRTARIERGSLQATVSASGTVNPVTQVSVGTQVSGQIKELYVDFNSEVKAGQLIALIDPETFEYRVRQAQADVDSAQAAVLTAQANGAVARAALSRAKVDLAEAHRDHDRKKMLVDKEFIARSEAEKAQALVNTTREGVASAEAQLGVAQAQLTTAQANVAQRQAALAQARVDLQRTRIASPVNGIVIKRAIEKGQTVAASLQAPELFVIAQNLQDMQVDASIDESDVSRIRPGQRATFTVDAFPGQSFEGEIRQVRKAAQTVANVVTYVAVIGFSNTAGRLLPGMTANVRVVTDVRDNVLKVPNAALRVRIAGVEPAAAPASGGGKAAAPTTTGSAGGWSFWPQAMAQQGGGGGGLAAMRERLTAELGLSADQQVKLDAIAADLRPQLMALRELPEAGRGAAREKVMGEMRSRIDAMLLPEQKAKYAQIVAQAQANRAGGGGGAAPGAPQAAAPSSSAAATPKQAKPVAPGAATPSPPVAGAAPAPSLAPGASPPPGAAAPPGGGGGPGTEFRQRLVAELQLTPQQQAQVDAIYADMRPKFMGLRDLAADERPKARERLMAEIRARIGDVLTPEQKPKYAALVAETAGRQATRGRIYLLGEDGKPKAYNVRLGISDGTNTELIVSPNSPDAGELKEGANVVTGVSSSAAPPRPAGQTGPRMAF